MKKKEKFHFATKKLPPEHDHVAPDGSVVRPLLGLNRGALAHFELLQGRTSVAVAHRTVEEIWYFINGQGEMWRKLGDHEEVVVVEPGVAISLPVGTYFQLRAFGDQPLAAIGATMPPWPGADEAYQVQGKWIPTTEK